MTKRELIDYCMMYWQHLCEKVWEIMKDFPCDYIDYHIGIHSLTYGEDAECCYALHIDPQHQSIYLSNGCRQFYDNSVVEDDVVYGYDEIDDKKMDTFVSIVLYIAKHEEEIIQRMNQAMNLINYIKDAAK